jgi:hypothetical protein
MTCNASTISIGSAFTTDYALTTNIGSTFTGGTGANHTIGSLTAGTASVTLTSGITTFTSAFSSHTLRQTSVVAHGGGTVVITENVSDSFIRGASWAFNNLTINTPRTISLRHSITTYTVGALFTITQGVLDTVYAGISINLTVTGATSISGTLTCNGSTITAAAVTIADGGLYSNMTATSNLSGNLIVGAGVSGSMTTGVGTIHIDGTTTIAAGASMGTAATGYTLNMDGSLLASAGTLIAPSGATWTFSGAAFNTPTTLTMPTGTITFDLAGTSTLQNNSIQFYHVIVGDGATLATSTYNFTATGNLVVGGGASGALTTSTGTKAVTGTTTINAGATLGSAATNFNLDLDGSMLASAGTLIAPTSPGILYFGGSVWNTPTVYTHSSSWMDFNRVGVTTLGNDSTQFYDVQTDAGTTLSTTATNYALTCADNINLFGSLTGNGSAITTKIMSISATGVYTATTALTTITGAVLGVSWTNLGTFTHSGGTVTFTSATGGEIYGNNLWNDLLISLGSAPTFKFEGAKTQSIDAGGYCNFNGAAGFLMILDSTNASDWLFDIDATATYDFAYLNVDQSDASAGREAEAAFSTDAGTNTNWEFGGASVFVWDGGGADALASTANNWEGNAAPGVTSSVLFDVASQKDCTWDIQNTAGNINIGDEYTGTITLSKDIVLATFTMDGAATWTSGAYNVEITTGFTQSAGTCTGPTAGKTLTFGGATWDRTGGTFAIAGATIFNGTDQAINGDNNWAAFTKSVAVARTLTIEAGTTQQFTGAVTLAGAAGQLLSIISDTPGTYFNFKMTAPAVKTSLTRLYVKDSDASGSDAAYKPILPTFSTNGGHTLDWFPATPGGSGVNAMMAFLEYMEE